MFIKITVYLDKIGDDTGETPDYSAYAFTIDRAIGELGAIERKIEKDQRAKRVSDPLSGFRKIDSGSRADLPPNFEDQEL